MCNFITPFCTRLGNFNSCTFLPSSQTNLLLQLNSFTISLPNCIKHSDHIIKVHVYVFTSLRVLIYVLNQTKIRNTLLDRSNIHEQNKNGI